MQRGKLITLEGLDGAGKSTHVPFIADYLAQRGIDCVLTREPGGTALGEQLRALLLDPATEVSLATETLLMFAARQEHIDQVIEPALGAGRWVLSDRFTDATFAFQGGGRGVPVARIAVLEHWVQQGLNPDLTLLFDVPTDVAQARLNQARTPDRFEQEAEAFHRRVRDMYLARAAGEPGRIQVLNASLSISALQQEISIRLAPLAESVAC